MQPAHIAIAPIVVSNCPKPKMQHCIKTAVNSIPAFMIAGIAENPRLCKENSQKNEGFFNDPADS